LDAMGSIPTSVSRQEKAAASSIDAAAFLWERGGLLLSACDALDPVADVAEIASEAAGGAATGAEDGEEGEEGEGEGEEGGFSQGCVHGVGSSFATDPSVVG